MQRLHQCIHIADKEIEILENRQYAYICNDAKYKEPLSPFALRLLNIDARKVIDNDGEEQYENINRNESTIENATCQQQMQPSPFMRQQKIKNSYNRKKQQEIK